MKSFYKQYIPNLYTFSLLGNLWNHFSKKRRTQIFFLMLVMALSGILEVVSLGSVIPFLTIISSPESIENNLILQRYIIQNYALDYGQLVFVFSGLFAFASLLSGTVRLFNIWLNARLSALITSDLSCKGFNLTLSQPYKNYLRNNSSKLIIASTKQFEIIGEVIRSSLLFLTSLIISSFIVLVIFYVNWKVTVNFVILLVIAYFFIGIFVKEKLLEKSKLIEKNSLKLVNIVQESLGSIREILLEGLYKRFNNLYKTSDIIYRINLADNLFYRSFPRYSIETLALVLIALFSSLLINFSKNTNVIPVLGFIALALQKLIPSFQIMYSSWAYIQGTKQEQIAALKILNQCFVNTNYESTQLKFKNEIRLNSVNFKYESSRNFVLSGLNLSIKKGERIGIIGDTGSGKSTLIDILMGLLEPTSGEFFVDNINLYNKANANYLYTWRKLIAHVPQNIFLTDSTIAENIAFGIDYKDIDFKKVRSVSKKAEIENFIMKSTNFYNQKVGERGILLSGGQRQRVGIARALYKNKKILIFDEATSALDNNTEFKVMNSIYKLNRDLTFILVAHRLSSLKDCDRILKLDNGKIY